MHRRPLVAMSVSAPALLLSLSLLLLLRGCIVHGCTNVASLSQALETVLAEYDRELPPNQTTSVRATFDLRHASIKPDSTVHVLGDLTLSWLDPRIGWNASEWGCNSVMASSDRLWLPDVELLNSAGGGDEAALTARLTDNGQVSWVLRYDTSVPIHVDLTSWPADAQIATFKFGSRAHSYDELEMEVNKVEHVVLFESGAWELVSVTGGLHTQGSRRVALYSALMRRRAAAHRAATGAVLAAAILLLAAASMLPPLSRPPLCACASFTAAIWLVTALLRLPSSSTTPVSLAALCAMCAAGGAAGAAAALVARVARCSSQPPQALKELASTLSTWCRLAPTEETSESASTGAWVALATLLDYALLGVLLLTLFVIICISL